jgi:FkbM family methyltransferase
MGILKKARKRFADRFLRKISGVIHVGANVGQEQELYARLGLAVLWIEPIPDVFAALSAKLRGVERQRALEYLVTDKDGAEYEFHISSNAGLSSSIMDLKDHRDVWPEVEFTRSIKLKSMTLKSLLEKEGIDPAQYDALIMDTQGSELLVLKGAEPILRNFKFIKTEIADFEAYAGCCQLPEMEDFMKRHRYRESSRHKFSTREGGGNYWDIVYARIGDRP